MLAPIVFGTADAVFLFLLCSIAYYGRGAHRNHRGDFPTWEWHVARHLRFIRSLIVFCIAVSLVLPLFIEPQLRAEIVRPAPTGLYAVHFACIGIFLVLLSVLYTKVTGIKMRNVHGLLGWTCVGFGGGILLFGTVLAFTLFRH